MSTLYQAAATELSQVKAEKPRGRHWDNALALTLRPVMYNLVAYHLAGGGVYAKQARHNTSLIMHRLEANGWKNLRLFLSFLIEDMKEGPAILG
jgi:hypothetical protein